MTFITQTQSSDVAAGVIPAFGLTQRGRSSLEILGALQKFSSSALRETARANFRADPEGKRLTETHDETAPKAVMRDRLAKAREVAGRDPVHRMERFFQRYVAEENFTRGIPAMEERRAQYMQFAQSMAEGAAGGSLELDPDLPMPKYYAGVEWHLEPGGWDGYDLYGPLFAFGVGPLVFRHGGYSAVGVGADIIQQRVDTVRQLPKASYERVYEPGCGGVSTLSAVHQIFPEAELVGCDLSPLLLKNGHAIAERRGIKAHLKQRDALDTQEPNESFDAVITYALHHELPPKANIAMFQEMFRIMKPGADIVISDPPPFRAVEPYHAVILDWDNDHKEEPFFTASLLSDWNEELRKIGFVNIEAYALGQDSYPWIIRASKPEKAVH
jgi:SAM-dependent methyltransferase